MAITQIRREQLLAVRYDFLKWLEEEHKGRTNSIMARDMKRWGNDREVRFIVHQLRVEGHPIGSYSKGYYYATTEWEIEDTMEFVLASHRREAYEGLKKSKLLL
ncbi:hypothetical protein [Peribacillus asahii]|uniref:hypothetical protein n=1 Tax=Peribacillus asahii TaxID=228899 RepID=UPI0037F4A521